METDDLQFVVRRGITDHTPRKLILNPEFLQFESNDLATNLYTKFSRNEIAEFRYGMKWITFEITFGRQYFIYIRNDENKIIKINFRTYFGIKKTECHKLYSDIVQNLRKIYFDDIVIELINKYQKNEEFSIGEVDFNKDYIKIKVSGVMNVTDKIIYWNDIRTRDYISYFSIYSDEDPSKINRGYSYLNDWNTYVLYCVLRTILKNKGIENYE